MECGLTFSVSSKVNAAPESAHGRPGAGALFQCENHGVERCALKVAGVGNAMIGDGRILFRLTRTRFLLISPLHQTPYQLPIESPPNISLLPTLSFAPYFSQCLELTTKTMRAFL